MPLCRNDTVKMAGNDKHGWVGSDTAIARHLVACLPSRAVHGISFFFSSVRKPTPAKLRS